MALPDMNRLNSCLDHTADSLHEVIKYDPSPLPANHYDADTTEPISCGLQTFEELLSWNRSKANPFNMATVPLARRQPSLSATPRRTLVSHDMMGGYLDDRFVQGTNSEEPYAFYHWNYIDIFNYFTHNLVTIPPVVWTNAAHKHAVVVLGTFITEWTGGAKVCETFLADEESYRVVADKLVQISLCYGFDGWLINIENSLSEVAVKNTPLFLRYLTDQMHERNPHSLVIWYDSVLQNGQLNWQNEINNTNRQFFDACDGFFTNYNWTEQHLERMRALSWVENRQADVYVGIDVFARGAVVGGKLDTNKALEVIRKHNFSTAIFAAGWVYESLVDKTEFRMNQDRFWALLSDFLYVHQLSSPLPFISSFCQGFGKALFWRGQHVAKQSWFNLSAQEVQPLYYSEQLEGNGWLRSRGCPHEAWNGGSSLLLEGLFPAQQNKICASVFSLHVPLAPHTLMFLIYKPSRGISVSFELKTTGVTADTQTDQINSVAPVELSATHQLVSRLSQLFGQWSPDGWTIRCSELRLHDHTLREVRLCIQRAEREPGELDTPFSCRLGELMVLDAASLHLPPEQVQGMCLTDVVWLRGAGASSSPSLLLNATLRWDYPLKLVRQFNVYWRQLRGPHPQIPPGQRVLVGRAFSNIFRVTELAVREPPCMLELLVEPVSREGFLTPETHWGRKSLSYTVEAM